MGKIDYGHLSTIIQFYESVPGAEYVYFSAFRERYSDQMCFQRMGRAFSNVCDPEAIATDSRFAIWGSDLFNLAEMIENAVQSGDNETALRILGLLKRNTRSFVDCCALLDSQPEKMQFETQNKVFSRLKVHMEENGTSVLPDYEYLYRLICEYADED